MNPKQLIIIGVATLLLSVGIAYANGTISNVEVSNIICTGGCYGFGNGSSGNYSPAPTPNLTRLIVYNNIEQSNLTNGELIQVQFNTKLVDTKNEWDTVNNKWTATNAGWYAIMGRVSFVYYLQDRDFILYAHKNNDGTDPAKKIADIVVHSAAINSLASITAQFTTFEHFNAGEYLTLQAQSNVGNNNVALGGYCTTGVLCDIKSRAYSSLEIMQLSQD